MVELVWWYDVYTRLAISACFVNGGYYYLFAWISPHILGATRISPVLFPMAQHLATSYLGLVAL